MILTYKIKILMNKNIHVVREYQGSGLCSLYWCKLSACSHCMNLSDTPRSLLHDQILSDSAPYWPDNVIVENKLGETEQIAYQTRQWKRERKERNRSITSLLNVPFVEGFAGSFELCFDSIYPPGGCCMHCREILHSEYLQTIKVNKVTRPGWYLHMFLPQPPNQKQQEEQFWLECSLITHIWGTKINYQRSLHISLFSPHSKIQLRKKLYP